MQNLKNELLPVIYFSKNISPYYKNTYRNFITKTLTNENISPYGKNTCKNFITKTLTNLAKV
jgi:hypothetical protein